MKATAMDILRPVKSLLKSTLDESQTRRLRQHVCRIFHRKDLARLAMAFGSDKEGGHHYAKDYQRHFEPLRRRRLNVLEIGIGGYDHPLEGGASLRMWRAYFPKSRIFGIDLHDKSHHDGDRIKTFQGSQADASFLERVAQEIGRIDIIIDDGSHHCDHVITTFKVLFPLLDRDGIYVVEDLQTSYWEECGGAADLNAPHTSMNFFKRLVDGLNHEEFRLDTYEAGYFDRNIISLHFSHNLVFVYKGQNNEGSNIVSRRSA